MATTEKFLDTKVDFSGNTLKFKFAGCAERVFSPAVLPAGIAKNLILWGLKEKLANVSAGLTKNRETVKADLATQRLWEALCSGNWTITLSAEEREAAKQAAILKEKTDRKADLIEAARRLGYKAEKVDSGIAGLCKKHGWSDADNAVLALLGQPDLKREYLGILAERAQEKAPKGEEIDIDAMFA